MKNLLKIISVVYLLSLSAFADGDSLFSEKWGVHVTWAGGYTHYDAKDLNDVMQALEHQSSTAAGLNQYEVGSFHGHPMLAATIGVYREAWELALELEFWVEDFHQSEIPFYMNRDLDPRFPAHAHISCSDVLAPGFTPVQGGTAGCIQAEEVFTIVPITLQLSRHFSFWRDRVWLGVGGGAGVLAGNAKLKVQTEFVGKDARPNDTMKLTLYPGVNPVFKVFSEAGVKPLRWLGFSLQGGYRWSGMKYVEISEKKGDSFLFGLALGGDSKLSKGNRAYLIRTSNGQGDILVLRDAPTTAEVTQAKLAGNQYSLVKGDFSGWTIEAKVNLWWGIHSH